MLSMKPLSLNPLHQIKAGVVESFNKVGWLILSTINRQGEGRSEKRFDKQIREIKLKQVGQERLFIRCRKVEFQKNY